MNMMDIGKSEYFQICSQTWKFFKESLPIRNDQAILRWFLNNKNNFNGEEIAESLRKRAKQLFTQKRKFKNVHIKSCLQTIDK